MYFKQNVLYMFLKANVNTYVEVKEKGFYFFQETTEKNEVEDRHF